MRMQEVLSTKPDILQKLCKGVDRIIQPLSEAFDLTFFSYKRIDVEGNFIFLTNHYPWLRHCIEKKYIQYLNSYDIKQDIILWDGIEQGETVLSIMKDANDNFNIAHGITLITRSEKYVEHFNFATTVDNTGINNFYLSSTDLLERFIIYFKDKASGLIKAVENYSVNLKDIVFIKRSIKKQEFYADVDYFIEKTNIKTIHLVVDNTDLEVNYTLARCGYLIMKGYSYKQIAKLMYVSVKTIEARLAKLRSILKVRNKKELIGRLSEPSTQRALDVAFIHERSA